MLTQLEKKYNALKAFDFEAESRKAIEENKDVLADLQREQLLAGRDISGNWIRPFYSENKFFKKPGAAQRYAEWKSHISPNKDKPKDVPDLFIVGYYHKSLKTNISGDKFQIISTVPLAFDIESVHSKLGLDRKSQLEFIEKYVKPEVLEQYRKKVVNI